MSTGLIVRTDGYAEDSAQRLAEVERTQPPALRVRYLEGPHAGDYSYRYTDECFPANLDEIFGIINDPTI